MNYDRARELKDRDGNPSGKWRWTSMNDRVVYEVAPCTDECDHNSAEEAEKHFYEYCLEQVAEYTYKSTQHKCMVCGEWTQKGLGNMRFELLGLNAPLCDNHRNKEEIRKLFPYEAGLQLAHS